MHYERRVLLDVLLTSQDGIDTVAVEGFARSVKGLHGGVGVVAISVHDPAHSVHAKDVAASTAIEAGEMVVVASAAKVADLEDRLAMQTKVAQAANSRCVEWEAKFKDLKTRNEHLDAALKVSRDMEETWRLASGRQAEELRYLCSIAGSDRAQTVADAFVSIRIERDVLREMAKRLSVPPAPEEPSRLLVERTKKFREVQASPTEPDDNTIPVIARRFHAMRLLAETAAVEVEQACVRFEVAKDEEQS